jgi:hypothetical protein
MTAKKNAAPQLLSRTLQRHSQFSHRRRELQFAEADSGARIAAAQLDLERQPAELALKTGDDEARLVSSSQWENEPRRMRNADGTATAAAAPGKRRAACISGNSGKDGGEEPRRGS